MNHLYSDHRRILLIDQNTAKQNLRATILRNYEIEVHAACSVEDAASLARRHAYDLILLAAQEHSEDARAVCTLGHAEKLDAERRPRSAGFRQVESWTV
ncbi:MAG: hypothetical protein ABSA29_16980 [Terriglobales bacterium]